MSRDMLIMSIASILAVLLGAWVFLLQTPAYAPSAEGEFMPITVLQTGQQSGTVAGRTNYLIENRQDFLLLWQMMYGGNGPTIPTVDFNRYQVLAVFDGSHSSGGYSVAVSSVRDTGLRRVVTITHTEPGTGCMTTEAQTNPFSLVVVPVSKSTIAREDLTVVSNCN